MRNQYENLRTFSEFSKCFVAIRHTVSPRINAAVVGQCDRDVALVVDAGDDVGHGGPGVRAVDEPRRGEELHRADASRDDAEVGDLALDDAAGVVAAAGRAGRHSGLPGSGW